MTAQSVRDFLHTLFTRRLVLNLEEQIIEARRERDYFKGKSERLELVLESKLSVLNRAPSLPQSPLPMIPRRKTLSQLQAEMDAEDAARAKREAEQPKEAVNG